ncbi:MAG: hypothetical protein PHG45_03920 [Dehalococcoidales bacterium]|nr:hypothetical protein [Dehalococcoidales bacterium]
MQLNLYRRRIWIYRSLVVVVAGLTLLSAIQPWWTGDVSSDFIGYVGTIEIYPYGLSHHGFDLAGYAFHLTADETPFYQTVIAWIYIITSIGIILLSAWIKGRKGSWLLGSIGFINIAYALIAVYIVIARRLNDFNISLQGYSLITTEIPVNEPVEIYSSLQFGYYLACVAGLLCVIFALFRNLILSNTKSNTWLR